MNWLTSRVAPLAAFAALALAGCDKGTDLNVDLPNTTAINTQYKDLPVVAGTVLLAPVQTLKTDHFMVGRLVDNVAGTTTARAYFNVLSGTVTDSLPSKFTTAVLDSVVMVLGFDQVYGSATTPVKFDVYQLAAPLDERQVYDGGTVTPLGTQLGQNLTSRLDRTKKQIVTDSVAATPTTAGTPAVTTTVPDPTVRLLLQRRAVAAAPGQPAQPAINLPFANTLFSQLSNKTTNFDQKQLDALLKGIAVTPSAGHTSSVVSFGRSYTPRMVVYFHGDTLRRSYSVFFGPVFSNGGGTSSSDPRYYTQITNTLPPALAALSSRSGFVPAAVLNNTTYAQEGTGLGTRITFTGLETLPKTAGLTINRAELRVPVKPYTNALFPNPARLYAVEVDGNNTVLTRTINYIPTDRVVQADGSAQTSAGNPALGTADATSGQTVYTIPVTSYLTAYLANTLDGNPASLVLAPNIRSSSTLSLARAALDANNITLRVYYSQR